MMAAGALAQAPLGEASESPGVESPAVESQAPENPWPESLAGFDLVAENEALALFLNEETVEFAVLHKESGRVWHSNPHDRQRKETIAAGSNKAMLNAQLVLTYYLTNRQYQMDSYNDAVVHGQYQIHRIPGGFRIDFDFGKRWQDAQYLPQIISEERFNELILSKIPDERDRKFLRDLYILFELEEGYVDPDGISVLGVDMDALLGDYGVKVHDSLRASDKRRLFQEYLNLVREGQRYTTLGDVKPEDITGLYDTPTLMLRWSIREWDRQDAIALVKQTGYTPEDAAVDHERYGVAPPYPDLRAFSASLEVLLDGDTLLVRIPGDSITFPDRVYDPANDRTVTYPLTAISLLPYFGAADAESDGYLFIPDGTGALIYANNGKTTAQPYNRRVYGTDYAMQPVPELSTVEMEQIHLPVFGIKDNDQAFLAVIEQGDAIARIEAVVHGMRDSFNRVWASFDVMPQVRVHLEAAGELIGLRQLFINMYQSRLYHGDVVVRYMFLTGEEANYSGMARRYQDYLVDRYGLARLEPRDTLPLVLDVVAGIDRIQPVFGVPTNVVVPMTTYAQAEEIIRDLTASGIRALEFRLLGWLKGGINHVFPDAVRLEPKIGAASDLSRLAASLEALGGGLYPSVDFTVVHRDRLTDSFIGFRHASRFLNRKQAYVNQHNIATLQPDDSKRRALVSPAQYDRIIDGFARGYSRLGIGGLSLGDLGRRLVSDFRLNPTNLVDRQQALGIVTQELQRLKELGLDLMIEGANAYALPYASYVVNAPWFSRGPEILDEPVPFYQMVLSGYIPHAAPPGNLTPQDRRVYMLKLLETGALPSFAVAYADSSLVKKSSFDHLYSLSYEAQKERILSLYHEIEGVHKNLWRQRILEHSCVDREVCATRYEDGSVVVVNYGHEGVVVEGVRVPPLGFAVIRETSRDEGGAQQ